MLVNQMLDVSRIQVGRLDLQREPVDLAELVRDVVGRHGDEAERAGCELTVWAERARGLWDPMRIDQVVTNLLANALKYGAGAPVQLKVAIAGSWARLTVTDHGIGIAAKERGRLFQRWGRLAHERHYAGLGLGLWIAQQIVEQHGGRIDFESQPNAGATFIVDLPLLAG
jgi:signal transduction histidine kinase